MATTTVEIENRIPFLTPEEEDALIHLRILSEDRALRKLTKKLYSYAFSIQNRDKTNGLENNYLSAEEEREIMLAEIATYQLALQKNTLVYQAESRQVLEYEKEKERIVQEQDVIRRQIAELKVTLDEEHMFRKRKIEYDQIAEKINALPSRADSEASISSIKEEIAAIREENDHKSRMMHARKIALDQIVSSIEVLRAMDKEPESSAQTQEPGSAEGATNEDTLPKDEQDEHDDDRRNRERERQEREQEEDNTEDPGSAPSSLNPAAKPFLPKGALDRVQNSERNSPMPSRPHSAAPSPAPQKSEEGEEREEGEDIEMGEVSEVFADNGAKLVIENHTHQDNELEEGEASDGGSPQAGTVPN